MNTPIFLDEDHVRKHLRMADLIPAMERALIDFSAGKVIQPVRQVIPVDPPGGFYGIMPALTPDGLGQKIVTFYPPNAAKGIPTHMALIVLNDPETGSPLAVVDGRLITEMRTAAVSAAATKLLAPKNAKVLAILGSGVQARSHFEALSIVREFEEIRVWSPNQSHADACAKEILESWHRHPADGPSSPQDESVRLADRTGTSLAGSQCHVTSAEDAVRGADVVVTVTSSKTPVLHGAWLKPGCHVNAVGACRHDWRELDAYAMRNSVVFVDSREAAMKESGDVIHSKAKIYAELGQVFAGKVPPRTNETTIFKSLGMAVEDIVSALLVYRAATAAA